ncbi:hypothetical protein PQ478_08275 [Alkalihalophilus pseudofirmus]|uniref:hypothetical protein n=1 Tax=Alkalihalophilus pseudofirmus TaxID=79885 RepID=UPI00259BAC9F|nr:hypothetical protein [Alkalihalophilus pseudofirmus]WEG18465.1 hypothetical protein PQ478_08275 [Alkalihalophilus pseudofirmus]
MEKVNFRYSDSYFIGFLMTIGYEHNHIEVNKDRNGNIKTFVHIEGIKDDLIDLFNDFQNGNASVNPKSYATNIKKIKKLIAAEQLKYQANQLSV